MEEIVSFELAQELREKKVPTDRNIPSFLFHWR